VRAEDAVSYGQMVVCGSCGGPKGFVPSDFGALAGAEQLCECSPLEEGRSQPTWGGDFNSVVELCQCCALAGLPSGSRWSPLLCKPCLSRARV
jgi:hypothetical protein